MHAISLVALALSTPLCPMVAQEPTPPASQTFTLANAKVAFQVHLAEGHVQRERLSTQPAWASSFGHGAVLETDGRFTVDVVWNHWQAPGKANNGDVLCSFGPRDFTFVSERRSHAPGVERLSLTFHGPEYMGVEVEYSLGSAPWIRRRLRVFERPHNQYARKEPSPTGHLLHALNTYDAQVHTPAAVIKAGGFGQPVALGVGGGGAFVGLEWPAATNRYDAPQHRLIAGQEMGEAITFEGVWGEPVVLAVTPNAHVKDWFTQYLDEIRVAKLRPYTLYNSWYDLRSAEYPRVKPHQVMNEENVLRIVKLVQDNMVNKHGITMDAFVLDDGWDVYKSDWALRTAQFPRGLAPIAQALKATGTRLGIWYGPTGGYSFHGVRTEWFKANGYEVTDSNMLSVLGPKYAALFQKRTTDMAKDGVAYFKWDGLQFVDNNPKNGGPIGIYGRRAAMKNVIRFCEAVRAVNPDMFLNVTSGTWLSPWWMMHADQIWMDGGDFGAADVPSISTRDSSITYRDMVLYEDFHKKGLWFPVSNLMTHGILKGHIDVENIGKGEPLSKFADEVAFYLARGVSMYELYIAPDILNEGEWKVLADNLRWARDRFDVLSRGEMIGGDPGQSQPYGYTHFRNAHGVLALRNPDIQATTLDVVLDPAHGLAPHAADLVLERIYPTRWVSPTLFKAGDKVSLPLGGFEAAIYELRPLGEVRAPLVAGVVYEADAQGALTALEVQSDAKVLNPDRGTLSTPLAALKRPEPPPVASQSTVTSQGATLEAAFTLDPSARQATLGVLLRPSASCKGKADPTLTLMLDGRPITPERVDQPGVWAWVTLPNLSAGPHRITLQASPGKGEAPWEGRAQVWLTATQKVEGTPLKLKAKEKSGPRPMLATGRGPMELPRTLKLGEAPLALR